MSKILKKWQNTNMTYRLLALACSLVLFLNVNNDSYKGGFASNAESYEETAENVPVNLIYDTDKYYVHGYEAAVKVDLTSVNRVQLDAETNEDTRGFKVTADLSDLGVGTHEVKLRARNLRSAVTASIKPKTITVTIEKLVTKSMEVKPVISSSVLADGFKLGDVSVNPKKVTITTGEDTLQQIDRLIATVNPAEPAKEDFVETANVEAVDSSGEALSMIADPQKVRVSVKVTAPKKEVSLKAVQQGTAATGVSSYEISLAEDTATISGAQSVLDKIDSISIPVDITGVTVATTKQVEIPTDDYTANPKVVRVTIRPVFSTESSTSTSNSGSATNNNSSNNNSPTNNNTIRNSASSEESSKPKTETTVESSKETPTVDDSGEQ